MIKTCFIMDNHCWLMLPCRKLKKINPDLDLKVRERVHIVLLPTKVVFEGVPIQALTFRQQRKLKLSMIQASNCLTSISLQKNDLQHIQIPNTPEITRFLKILQDRKIVIDQVSSAFLKQSNYDIVIQYFASNCGCITFYHQGGPVYTRRIVQINDIMRDWEIMLKHQNKQGQSLRVLCSSDVQQSLSHWLEGKENTVDFQDLNVNIANECIALNMPSSLYPPEWRQKSKTTYRGFIVGSVCLAFLLLGQSYQWHQLDAYRTKTIENIQSAKNHFHQQEGLVAFSHLSPDVKINPLSLLSRIAQCRLKNVNLTQVEWSGASQETVTVTLTSPEKGLINQVFLKLEKELPEYHVIQQRKQHLNSHQSAGRVVLKTFDSLSSMTLRIKKI